MAHPLRRRLLDVLKVHGPGTVSVLAEHTGQRVANVSHHLRVLADAGLVAEASELARDKREHWWRLIAPAVRWSTADFSNDPAGAAVAQAAQSLSLNRHTGLVQTWHAADEDERGRWEDADFSTDRWLHLTPAELAELSAQVTALFDGWGERTVPADGQRREPVMVFAYGVPARP